MATDTDIKCGAPGNTADSTWFRSGDLNWYSCVASQGDSKSARMNNYTGSGDDGRDFGSFGYSGVPTYCVINSLTMRYWASRSGSGAGTMKVGWHLGGAVTWGASNTVAGSWYSDSMGRPGGGSWTRSDLANLNVRFYGNGDATQSREIYVDEMLVRVNWDYITLNTLSASSSGVSGSEATITGSYNANGDGDTEWRMVYGTTTGVYDSPSWTANTGTGTVTAPTRTLTGLSANTTYYYRLEARNSGDVAYYSAEQTFTTTGGAGGLILFF